MNGGVLFQDKEQGITYKIKTYKITEKEMSLVLDIKVKEFKFLSHDRKGVYSGTDWDQFSDFSIEECEENNKLTTFNLQFKNYFFLRMEEDGVTEESAVNSIPLLFFDKDKQYVMDELSKLKAMSACNKKVPETTESEEPLDLEFYENFLNDTMFKIDLTDLKEVAETVCEEINELVNNKDGNLVFQNEKAKVTIKDCSISNKEFKLTSVLEEGSAKDTRRLRYYEIPWNKLEDFTITSASDNPVLRISLKFKDSLMLENTSESGGDIKTEKVGSIDFYALKTSEEKLKEDLIFLLNVYGN
ncbi:hypothetical protein [Fluviicola chungangensis]|uniref:Uncharacterized protein n=1 Tax=Fluviicola chungangensis TaxID=2597671 RepID=A0A556N7D2_9FLAO|nr:hypothetical protein [Fluviicola chungangensis]TSJ47983.1 hypothetical protein FO442_02295 [Fluviicola chungangensis]